MLGRFKDKMFVYFVGDDRYIVFGTQVSNQRQFALGKDASAGIVRRVKDQCTRLLTKRSPQLIGVERPGGGMERHIDRYSVRHADIGHIRIVKKLDDNHLIARVPQPQNTPENTLVGSRSSNHP